MTPFRVAFVPGVMPGKWLRRWAERYPHLPLESFPVEEVDQRRVLDEGRAELCFVRDLDDREGLHLIPLYRERAVVVVPRDHAATAYEELVDADLVGEFRLEVGSALSARQAVETVAAGTGVVVLPMAVARLHHRRDVVHIPVTDLPETLIGLAWRQDLQDARIEDFIGIVRGRTPRSSRG